MAEEVYPGEVVSDAAGNKVGSTATIFPIVVAGGRVFVLYLKTKNFRRHMRSSDSRDYHLLLDEHADQLFAMTDEIAERSRPSSPGPNNKLQTRRKEGERRR